MALTNPINTQMLLPLFPGSPLSLPVAASTKIFKGSIVCVNSSGYAVPGGETSTFKTIGIADDTIDNSAGSNGAKSISLLMGVALIANLGTDLVTQSMIGAACYLHNEYQVRGTNNGGAAPSAGTVAGVTSSAVLVSMQGATSAAAGGSITLPIAESDVTGLVADLAAKAVLPIAESDVTNLTTDLAAKAATATTISAGAGLSGGGSLAANRTLTLNLANANTWTAAQTFNTSAAVFGAGATATGSSSFNLSGSTGTFLTSTGQTTLGGSLNVATNAIVIGANSASAGAGVRLDKNVDPVFSATCVDILQGDGSAVKGLRTNHMIASGAIVAYDTNTGRSKTWGSIAGVALASDGGLTFSSTLDAVSGSADVTLSRAGAATLGVNATIRNQVTGNQTTTIGAAGSADPLPALPEGYLTVQLAAGTSVKIPYYTAA